MLGKTELLEAIAGKNRGLLASEGDRQAILAAVARLEDRNPNPRPFDVSEKLEGDWRLLFTTSEELLGIDRVPLLKLGQIYQCIRLQGSRIYNIAEVYGLPLLEGIVSVAARFQPVSERRVSVTFERFILGPQRFIGYQSPTAFIGQLESGRRFFPVDATLPTGDRQGWLDVTYLDDDLRIGRGNEGSVFVLSKTAS